MALVDSRSHCVNRVQYILWSEITEYADMSLSTLTLKCASCIVVAVCTREDREVNLNLLHLLTLIYRSCSSVIALATLLTRLTLCWVDLLELSCICNVELLQRELLAQNLHALLSDCLTDLHCTLERLLSLDQNRTISVVEQGCLIASQRCTNLVTERHLSHCLSYTTKADCVCRNDIATVNLLGNHLEVSLQLLSVWSPICIRIVLNQVQAIASLLELRADSLACIECCDTERNEGWRYVDILECSAHRVLTTNRRQLKRLLHADSTEQCRHWLAPRTSICHTLEVLLI